jgi:hypothetical protein
MHKKVAGIVAGISCTVVIPTVVTMIWEKIDPQTGYWIIGASAAIGAISLAVAMWPSRRQKPDIAESAIDGPKDGWIALGDAPFDLAGNERFAKHQGFMPRSLIEARLPGEHVEGPPRHPKMRRNVASPEFRTKKGSDLVLCTIDWDKREFVWSWETEKGGFGFGGKPWEFDGILSEMKNTLGENLSGKIKERVAWTWRDMTSHIWSLAQDGYLKLWARAGSPAAPFTPVPFDGMRHYSVVDWQKGRAETKKGDVLYSLHVEIASE